MKKENIDKYIKGVRVAQRELKNYLFTRLDDFKFEQAKEHTVDYSLGGITWCIWVANGEQNAKFYDNDLLGDGDLEYTKEQTNTLWEKVIADKEGKGETRHISMNKLSNDLFFSFGGLYETVKFTGYNDNDWWEKYAPTSVKEGDIVWVVDLKNMVARYGGKKG